MQILKTGKLYLGQTHKMVSSNLPRSKTLNPIVKPDKATMFFNLRYPAMGH